MNNLKIKNLTKRLGFVGMTGFEPATTRPPAVYANRTAPHPDFRIANISLFIFSQTISLSFSKRNCDA